jgi:hypothetical protein
MYILSVHWDLLMLWAILSLTAKLYIFCLLAAVVYTIYSLSRTMVRFRSMKRTTIDAEPAGLGLLVIARTIENVRQLHLLLLYLFGVTLANEVFATLRAIRESAVSFSALGVDVFEPCAAFAFLVSGVLAILHTLQWIVAVRLRRSV